MLIDTHTHLYLPEFEGEQEQTVKRAIDAGVLRFIFPNVDLSTIEPMRALAAKFPENISMAMGLHPTEVGEDWEEALEKTIDELHRGDYVAVGEVGIDLYWDKTYEREQMLAFDRQVAEAERLGLPVIIHCREGLPQTLEVLSGHPGVQAVLHSFGGSVEDVEAARRVGDYYFGINGVVTFKNCHVRDALSAIGLDRLVLETDAPYLAPVPYRGKRNESSYLVKTAEHIAAHLNLPLSTIASRTTDNAQRLFFNTK
ncbi:MAG: TatD family hydrolase [Bacteroidales bacterium]|nr:TatD family hydrolase [Bacteroidales bacterium]